MDTLHGYAALGRGERLVE